jgi:hypothetical protein
MACKGIKPKPSKTCIGNFKTLITIKTRTKSASNTDSAEPNLVLAKLIDVWAMAKSVKGEEIFNGSSIVGNITDEFYIRYNPDIDIDITHNVVLNGDYLKIEDIIHNLEQASQLTVLRCSKRGLNTLRVNEL